MAEKYPVEVAEFVGSSLQDLIQQTRALTAELDKNDKRIRPLSRLLDAFYRILGTVIVTFQQLDEESKGISSGAYGSSSSKTNLRIDPATVAAMRAKLLETLSHSMAWAPTQPKFIYSQFRCLNLFICPHLFAAGAGESGSMDMFGQLLTVFFTVLRTPVDSQPGGYDDPESPFCKLGLRQKAADMVASACEKCAPVLVRAGSALQVCSFLCLLSCCLLCCWLCRLLCRFPYVACCVTCDVACAVCVAFSLSLLKSPRTLLFPFVAVLTQIFATPSKPLQLIIRYRSSIHTNTSDKPYVGRT
jgi:hypothetical protein